MATKTAHRARTCESHPMLDKRAIRVASSLIACVAESINADQRLALAQPAAAINRNAGRGHPRDAVLHSGDWQLAAAAPLPEAWRLLRRARQLRRHRRLVRRAGWHLLL